LCVVVGSEVFVVFMLIVKFPGKLNVVFCRTLIVMFVLLVAFSCSVTRLLFTVRLKRNGVVALVLNIVMLSSVMFLGVRFISSV